MTDTDLSEPITIERDYLVHLFELAVLTEDRTDDEQAAIEEVARALDDALIMDLEQPVMALGKWRTNGEMIADLHRLGVLRQTDRICDPTYGRGGFWTRWRPDILVGSDLDPEKSPTGTAVDMRDLPYPDGSFDVVSIDYGYKLNGTASSKMDDDYGVQHAASRSDRIQLGLDGMTEATRVLVTGGKLLVKTQRMVNGGKMRFQTDDVTDHARALGYVKVEEFVFPSYRPQPSRGTCQACGQKLMLRADGVWARVARDGSDLAACAEAAVVDFETGTGAHDPVLDPQQHARSNYSTLFVFQLERSPEEEAVHGLAALNPGLDVQAVLDNVLDVERRSGAATRQPHPDQMRLGEKA